MAFLAKKMLESNLNLKRAFESIYTSIVYIFMLFILIIAKQLEENSSSWKKRAILCIFQKSGIDFGTEKFRKISKMKEI